MIFSYHGKKDYEKAIDLAASAIRKIEMQAPTFLKNCFIIYDKLISLHIYSAQYPIVLETALKQLELLEANPDEESQRYRLMVFINLTLANTYTGRPDQAQVYFDKIEGLLAKGQEENQIWSMHTCGRLGDLFTMRGQLERSTNYTKKGLDLARLRFGENAIELFGFYRKLAYCAQYMEAFTRCIDYNKKAVFILQKNRERNEAFLNYNLPLLYYDIGMTYMMSNASDEALAYFEKALTKIGTNEWHKIAHIRIALSTGIIYWQKKDFDTASDHLGRADSLLQANTFQQVPPLYLADAKQNILYYSAIVWKAKENFDLAKKYFLEALSLNNDNGRANSAKTVHMELSKIFEEEGKLDTATYHLQKAMQYIVENGKPIEANQLPRLEELNTDPKAYSILEQYVRLRSKLALEAITTEEKSANFALAMQAATLADQMHLENLRKMNVLVGGQIKEQIQHSIHNYQANLFATYYNYRFSKDQKIVEQGFHYTQKMKAQQLWLSLLKSEATSFGKLPNDLLEQEKNLLEQIQYYEKMALTAKQQQDSISANLYESDSLFNTQLAYEELLKEMEANYPAYYSAKFNFVPETSESLHAILKEKELLMEYVLTDSTLYILSLAKHQALQIKKVALDANVFSTIEDLNKLLQNSAMLRKSSREKFIRMSYDLYQQFLAPIEAEMKGKERLILIGDGMTNLIPFEVLLPSNEIKAFKDLDYLIKTHEVSYHYSANLFAKARRQRKVKNKGIFAFAPVYGLSEKGISETPKTTYNTLRAYDGNGKFTPLPESKNEVEAIVELFEKKNPRSTTIALQAGATEEALTANLQASYQFIHIAGHSFADLNHPKFSGIACFNAAIQQDSIAQADDGILYVGEIYNIDSKADLVTLSSCESGYGKLEKTEGLLGLNRAFIYAGTPNVVFSLWKVYDKVSASLMVDFYSQLLEGKNYATSLRQAKLNLLQNETTATPHFWSPYLLIGR